jgi:hypothetical protein
MVVYNHTVINRRLRKMVQMQNEVNKANQRNTGLLYINHEIEPIMSLDELSKLIIYLTQIYGYAVNNNVNKVMLRK